MKNNIHCIFICFVIGSFFFSSCLKYYDYTSVPIAGLTMVNGYSNDQSIVYYINERPVHPLAYKSFSWVNLLTGNRTITIKETNSPEVLVDTILTIEDKTYYTSFAFATQNKPMHFITIDKTIQSGKTDSAGVRFFNLATINGKVSLQIDNKTSKTFFKDRDTEDQVSATAHQSFIFQNSGIVNLLIKNETGNIIASKESVKLDTAHYYSIILIGKEDDITTPLHIDIIEQVVD